MAVLRLRTFEQVLGDPSVLFARRAAAAILGTVLIALSVALALALATWTVSDPSLTHATDAPVRNLMGAAGAAFADPVMQLFGLAAPLLVLPLPLWGVRLVCGRPLGLSASRLLAGVGALLLAPGFVNVFPVSGAWPLPLGLGGVVGSVHAFLAEDVLGITSGAALGFLGGLTGIAAAACLAHAVRPPRQRPRAADLGFQIRRQPRATDDEYGLDETDTYESDSAPLAALRGAIAHLALSARARLRGAEPRRRHGDAPTLRSVLAETDRLDQDLAVYRGRRSAPAPSPSAAQALPTGTDADGYWDDDEEEPEDDWAGDDARLSLSREAANEATSPRPARGALPRRARRAAAPERAPASFTPPLRGPAARLRRAEAAAEGTLAGTAGEERDAMTGHGDPYAASSPPWEDEEDWRAHSTGAWADESDDDDGAGEWDDGADDAADADDDPYFAEAARHAGAAGARGAPRPVSRPAAPSRVAPAAGAIKPGRRVTREAQTSFLQVSDYEFPPLALLAAPPVGRTDDGLTEDALEANARVLEGVLEDFGVKGNIIHVRPGPVVTLYELEPAPGIKSSRVIGLADDIARSMSAISARVAVIPGKNAIGIELPNRTRITVFLREILASHDFERTKAKLPMCLGKTIGGEAVIADLARMPHLLVAGTTGSGKSVAINTMILSLLYHHKPESCRIILIDPKMLELSVYDGIPHLLTPVVTDPKKAVTALRWAVREMEDRYRKMAKLGVRNIDGYNTRVREAERSGEPVSRIVQTGFDKATGEAIFEEEVLDLTPIPYIVCVVDEMADLMMVAGKDIEGAIQRLAQMARAAGIHLIMATQRPSVDVITGTIKANFPTRISFQVTSKIDSRTILGEMGAEQLLGMGDMLFMAGGGRIQRVHGPFVADEEVEDVVAHLKRQGVPEYLGSVLEDEEDGEDGGGGSSGLDAMAESDDLYDRAVALVLRDRKASTSYVQRRLSIGYNRAATLIERMEKEGVVSPANHAGKRDILVPAQEEVA